MAFRLRMLAFKYSLEYGTNESLGNLHAVQFKNCEKTIEKKRWAENNLNTKQSLNY